MFTKIIMDNEYGIFVDVNGTPRTTSLIVAEFFRKRHDDVLKAVRNLDCSEEFRLRNFAESFYKDGQNKRQPCIEMTRDGFLFLVMGFRGKRAASVKEAFIKRFDAMELLIKSLQSAKNNFERLMAVIKITNDGVKTCDFINEVNLINKIVLGLSAKQFKEKLGLNKKESIRPYLTQEQISMIDKLQIADVGLYIAVPDYQERKKLLTEYFERLQKEQEDKYIYLKG